MFPLLKILYIVSQSRAGGTRDWRDRGARGGGQLPPGSALSGAGAAAHPWAGAVPGQQEGRRDTRRLPAPGCSPGRRVLCTAPLPGCCRSQGGARGRRHGPSHHPTSGHGCGSLGSCRLGGCWGGQRWCRGCQGSRTLCRKEGRCWPGRGTLPAPAVPPAAGGTADPRDAASPPTAGAAGRLCRCPARLSCPGTSNPPGGAAAPLPVPPVTPQ